MGQQKTYWHLLQQRRMPTEYEIVTSKLLCYTGEGFTGKRFELDVPLLDWYKRFQQDSPLTCTSWENGCMFFLAWLLLCDIQDTASRWWLLISDRWLRADALSSQRPYKRPTKCGACNELPTESGSFNSFIVVSQPIARRAGRPIRCGSLCGSRLRNCSFVTTGLNLSLR